MEFGSLSDSAELDLIGDAGTVIGDFFGNFSTLFGIADYFTGEDFQEALAKGFMK